MGSKEGAFKSAATKSGLTVEEWKRRRDAGIYRCYCCKQWQKTEKFTKDTTRKTGCCSTCKECSSLKATASRYKIPFEEAKRLRSGKEECAICGRRQKLEVDHNHDTGKVRGFLCSRCNGALGHFLDNKELLQKAIAYLEAKDGI